MNVKKGIIYAIFFKPETLESPATTTIAYALFRSLRKLSGMRPERLTLLT